MAVLTFCMAAMVAVPFPLRAQTPDESSQQATPTEGKGRGGIHMEDRQIERLTKDLNLTADQVVQLKAIEDDTRTQMLSLRDDTSMPREQKHAKMESIHKDQQEKINGMLTDEQKTKYAAMVARMKQQREEHREQGVPPAPPEL